MALVKAVAGKLCHEVKYGFCLFLVYALFEGTLHESFLLGLHDLRDLFTHGASEKVTFSQAVAGKLLGNLHDLLLVHYDPVGLL